MVAAINNQVGNVGGPQDLAYYDQGVIFFNIGNYAAAWASFNEAIKINPREMIYYYMRGACSMNMGHYKSALIDYNKAMSLAKTNEERGWIHFDLALLYNAIGDEQNSLFHIVAAARLGNGLAQNICREVGIPY